MLYGSPERTRRDRGSFFSLPFSDCVCRAGAFGFDLWRYTIMLSYVSAVRVHAAYFFLLSPFVTCYFFHSTASYVSDVIGNYFSS